MMEARPLEMAPVVTLDMLRRLPDVRPVELETMRRPMPVVSALAWIVCAQPPVRLLPLTMSIALLLLLVKLPPYVNSAMPSPAIGRPPLGIVTLKMLQPKVQGCPTNVAARFW